MWYAPSEHVQLVANMKSKRKIATEIVNNSQTLRSPSSIGSNFVWHRILLLFIAFISGASIMIIEITANRILAPWFGNSIYTWSGLIGVILFSMSCGYYFGGWKADHNPSYIALSHLVLTSACLTISIPIVQSLLTYYFEKADIIHGPALASLFLFALPGFFLGAVSPFVTRLISLLSSDRQIGVSAGFVGMLSAFGSVIGTFLAGFVLIPKIQVNTIFVIIGGILISLSLSGYIFFGTNKNKFLISKILCILLIYLIIIAIFTPKPNELSNIIFDKSTFHHRIRVQENKLSNGDSLKTLYLDSTIEGAQYKISKEIPILYQQYWELVKIFHPNPKNVAFLGAGSFTMPEALSDAYPESSVDVMEIDPKVIEVGRQFFRIDEYPKMNPIVGDARHRLRFSNKLYDVIFGDAYNGIHHIPAHLITVEYFDIVKKRLSAHGIYMMNIRSSITGEKSELFKGIVNGIKTVFSNVCVFATVPNDLYKIQNIILVAAKYDIPSKTINYIKKKEENRFNELLDTQISPSMYIPDKFLVFTDNYCPIEYIIAKNLFNK